jgi:glycosyltransferase involved in cell wall biosynthesis
MRILHIVSTLKRGGVASSLAYLLPELDRIAGFDVDVATMHGSGGFGQELARLGLTPYRLDLDHKYDLRARGRLRSLILRGRYDVVHSHGWPCLLFAALAVPRGTRAPVLVTTEHNVTNRRRRPLLRPVDRLLYRPYSNIVAVSQAVADSLARWHPGLEPRITTIHNGILPDRFVASSGARERIRKEHGIPERAPALVTVAGGLTAQKGIDVLLTALASLSGTDALRPHLVLVGDGPLRSDLDGQARRLDLTPRVHFLGFRSDIPDLLAAADLFVLPSRWEGCPMVLLEAMAAGVPVVATRVGGVPEIVDHDRSGLLVPPEDPEALAAAIETILSSPDRAQEIAAAGCESVAKRFHAGMLAGELAALYVQITGARPDADLNECSREQDASDPEDLRASHLVRALSFLTDRVLAEAPSEDLLSHPVTSPVLPAFWYPLKEGRLTLDQETHDQVVDSFRATAGANFTHEQDLSAVLRSLATAGVEPALLKGMVTAETVFPSIGARSMYDIDLLVSESQVPDTARVLSELGYRPEEAVVSPTGEIDRLTKSIGTFTQSKADLPGAPQSPLDLHWDLINVRWFRVATRWSTDEIRARAVPVRIGDTSALALDPLDQILHFSYHQAVKHHLIDTKDYLDLDLLCRRHPESLDALPARAHEARLRSTCYHALTFTRELFNTPVPESVLVALRPDPLRLWLVRRFVSPDRLLGADLPSINVARGFLLNALMFDRRRDFARAALRAVWPEHAWLRQRMAMAGCSDRSPRLWHLKRLGSYLVGVFRRGS